MYRVNHYNRRRDMMIGAPIQIVEALVVLCTFATVCPDWSGRHAERVIRRAAARRRARA